MVLISSAISASRLLLRKRPSNRQNQARIFMIRGVYHSNGCAVRWIERSAARWQIMAA